MRPLAELGRFHPSVTPPDPGTVDESQSIWFVCRPGEILVAADDPAAIPTGNDIDALGVASIRRQFLGLYDGRPCWSVEPDPDAALPESLSYLGLRGLYGLVPDELFALAGRAIQTVGWAATHRYCGRCATPTEPVPGERALRCPACCLISYPRLSPAVIVLVERDGRALLAQGANFTNGMHSTLAGFVEPGETLEEAVRREIFEEVGILVTDIRYFGSQPWPFPHSLMIGFTAQYAGGEIDPDPNEIAAAGWFPPDALPPVTPSKLSIARQLIDDFVRRFSDQP
jgi:NAD+ diphosphatase